MAKEHRYIQCRVSVDDFITIKVAAMRAGQTVQDFCLETLLSRAKGEDKKDVKALDVE